MGLERARGHTHVSVTVVTPIIRTNQGNSRACFVEIIDISLWHILLLRKHRECQNMDHAQIYLSDQSDLHFYSRCWWLMSETCRGCPLQRRHWLRDRLHWANACHALFSLRDLAKGPPCTLADHGFIYDTGWGTKRIGMYQLLHRSFKTFELHSKNLYTPL